MLHDDPVLNAQRSIRRILQVVERAISAPSLPSSETNPSSEPSSSSSTANPQPPSTNPSAPGFPNPYGHGTSVQFPSLQPQAHPTSEDLIYLSDRSTSAGMHGNVNTMAAQQGGGGSQPAMPNPSSSSTAPGTGAGAGVNAAAGAGIAAPDAQNFFDFDVLATDLFSFFPLDLSAQQQQGI